MKEDRDFAYQEITFTTIGGEGLCNFEYVGGVVSMQVELTTDYDYLVLVGHRGTSVCDVPDILQAIRCANNQDQEMSQKPRLAKLNGIIG